MELKKELILELPDSEITASNAASLSNKLSQMANGAIYDDDKNIIPMQGYATARQNGWIDLWGLNIETQAESKKNIARLTDR